MSVFGNLFGSNNRAAPTGAGNGSSAVIHGSTGRTTVLPGANPAQNLQGGQGSQQQQQQQPQEEVNPLDSQLAELAQVWQTPTNADGKPIEQTPDPLYQPLFNFKNEDIIKQAQGLDFTAGLNPELAAKALGGDPAALGEFVNGAVRAAFAANQITTGKMLNDGFTRHSQSIDSALPTRIRNHQVVTSQSSDPILSSSAVSPMITAMKAMIAKNNPNLRPEQVQQAAEAFVTGVADVVHASKEETVQKSKQEEPQNWMKLVGLE